MLLKHKSREAVTPVRCSFYLLTLKRSVSSSTCLLEACEACSPPLSSKHLRLSRFSWLLA